MNPWASGAWKSWAARGSCEDNKKRRSPSFFIMLSLRDIVDGEVVQDAVVEGEGELVVAKVSAAALLVGVGVRNILAAVVVALVVRFARMLRQLRQGQIQGEGHGQDGGVQLLGVVRQGHIETPQGAVGQPLALVGVVHDLDQPIQMLGDIELEGIMYYNCITKRKKGGSYEYFYES